jgi:raffinose/stachyose/melibiose transport system substrate-binding protein
MRKEGTLPSPKRRPETRKSRPQREASPLSGAGLLILLAAALVALPGCDGGGAGKARDQRHLTFWHIQTTAATRKVVEDAVGRYEGDHPDVAVTTAAFKNDLFKQKLSQAMASGSTPDVFHTWGGGVLESFVREKQVADLTKPAEDDNLTSRLLPAALRFGTIDGKLYAVPMDVSVVVIWYNRAIFEKHGIEPPATLGEMKQACAKLRAAGVIPIALGNKDQWPGAFWFVYLATRIGGTKPFADAAGCIGETQSGDASLTGVPVARAERPVVEGSVPSLRLPNASGFEHPSFIEAGRALQELVKMDAFNPGADALAYDNARDLFIREQAAMILMGTWFLADLKSDAPQMLDRVDCFPFPAVEGGRGDPKIIVGGINSAYAVWSRSPFEKDAFGLIKELTSDATAVHWGATGRIPALRRDLVAGMIEPKTYSAARLLYEAPEIQLYYDQALPPKLGEMHKSTTQSLIAGTITPEEAARKMEALAAELAAEAKSDSPR